MDQLNQRQKMFSERLNSVPRPLVEVEIHERRIVSPSLESTYISKRSWQSSFFNCRIDIAIGIVFSRFSGIELVLGGTELMNPLCFVQSMLRKSHLDTRTPGQPELGIAELARKALTNHYTYYSGA